MNRRDWFLGRLHFIYREAYESSFGIMLFRGSPWLYGPTLDIWTGRRFLTIRLIRKWE